MRSIRKIDVLKYVLIILYLASIIPMLYMGRYIHPLRDDYDSSWYIHNLILNHRYDAVLWMPIINAYTFWRVWQGTYSAEMLFTLQPGAWIFPAYWITPAIIIGSISGAYIWFWRSAAKHIFKRDKKYGTIIALCMLILQFQYTPYLQEGFYWYNGSIYYGFFYALFIIEMALVIRYLKDNRWSLKKTKWIAILAFFISGGNYSTALVNCVLLMLITVYLFSKKHEKAGKMIKISSVALIGLILSMIAPGNAYRASVTTSMSPVRAIIESIKYALRSSKGWLGIQQIGLVIFLIPFIYLMVKEYKLSFINMAIAVAILFGVYAAQITPPYYAMSYPGAERQIDMYYYSFYMLIVCCFVCLIAWLSSVFKDTLAERLTNRVLISVSIVGAIVIAVGMFHSGVEKLNAYKTANEIQDGSADAYVAEYNAILEQIKASGEDCGINDIESTTEILGPFEISEDPEYWTNQSLAKFFGKQSIYLIK